MARVTAKAAAAIPSPGLSTDPLDSLDLEVSTRAKDRRPITSAEIQAHPDMKGLSDAAAESLADQVADRLVDLLQDHEPWRQEYIAKLVGYGDLALIAPRFPIEDLPVDADGFTVPDVSLRAGRFGISTVIEPVDYRIRGVCRKEIYRETGWNWTTQVSVGVRSDPLPGLETADYTVGNGEGIGLPGSYTAGYVLPGQIGTNPEGPRLSPGTAPVTARQPSTDYDIDQSTAYGDDRGSWVVPVDRGLSFLLEVTVAGTSAASATEPVWNTTIGGITVDGTVTFTTRAAVQLTATIRQALWMLARLIHFENKSTPCDAEGLWKVKRLLRKSCL